MRKKELCFSKCRRHHGIPGINPCNGPCETFKERFGDAELPTSDETGDKNE